MPSTRKYEQRLRAEASEETRRRILDALYKRLEEGPSEPVSIEQIAQLARVSRSTIYLIFGTRAGLFDALAAELFRAASSRCVEEPERIPMRARACAAAPSAAAAMFAAHRDVFRVALLDGAARPGCGRRQRCSGSKKARQRHVAARAEARRPGPAPRRPLEGRRRTAALAVVTSFDAFDVLYSGRGMSADEIAALMTEMAERTLYR